MEQETKSNKPTITLGFMGEHQRVVDIDSLVRIEFKDHRLATVARDEENAILLAVENPQSTGRAARAEMYLSQDSFYSILHTAMIFLEHNGIDLSSKLKELINEQKSVNYEYYPQDGKTNDTRESS